MYATFRILILSGLLLTNCEPPSRNIEGHDVLARIGHQKLYLSEVLPLISSETSPRDSIAFIDSYKNSWLKNQLMIGEANSFLSSDAQIDQLVNQYRDQLILHKFEQQIIGQNLDSFISVNQIKSYYQVNAANYLLNESILNASLIIIPKDAETMVNEAYRLLESNDSSNLSIFCINNDSVECYWKNEWITRDQLNKLPIEQELWTDLKVESIRELEIEDKKVILKILDKKMENDTIPFDLLKDKIKKIILHERKKQVLKQYREELYQDALKINKIKTD